MRWHGEEAVPYFAIIDQQLAPPCHSTVGLPCFTKACRIQPTQTLIRIADRKTKQGNPS